MKNTFIIILLISVFGCNIKEVTKELPRIAIAGIAIESSTFSPALSHEESFHAKTINICCKSNTISHRHPFFFDQ